MAAADGYIRIDTKINQVGAEKGLDTLTKGLKGFAAAVGLAFGVGAIISFGKACIDLASDLNEVQNVVATTFGSFTGLIESFADTAATSFGLSELAAKQYTGTLGAMLKSMGFTTAAAAAMSIEMAGLAGDMASFYNLDTEEAFAKIRSGISGETEPLKQLGINLSVANLEQYALAQGITTTYNAMTEQNKALLRYNYLLSVTADAQGDFAKTSNSWANQIRVLKLQWDSFKATMGGAFIASLTPVLQLINRILGALNSAATVFASFISAVTGQTQNVTTGAAEAAEEVDGLTDSTEASGDAAKKAAKGLASFDELNVLPSSGAAEGGAAGAGATTAGTTTAAAETGSGISEGIKKMVSNIQELLAPLKAINFDNLKESFSGLQQAIEPFAETIGAGLLWFYENVLVPVAAWTVEDFLPAFLDLLAGALEILGTVIDILKPGAVWLWNNFLAPIAAWTGGAIITILEGLASALSGISDWMKEHKTTVEGISIALGVFFGLWAAEKLAIFIIEAGGVVGILKSLKDALTAATIAKIKNRAEMLLLVGSYIKDFFVAIGSTIAQLVKEAAAWAVSTAAKVANAVATTAMTVATAAWNVICVIATGVTTAFGVAMSILTSPITLVVLAIAAVVAIVVLLIKHWDDVKAAAITVWNKIVEIWGIVATWFNVNVIQPVVGFFTGLWDSISGGVKTAWDTIVSAFVGAATWWYETVIEPVNDFFAGLWNGIKDGVTGAWDNLVEIFSGAAQWWYDTFIAPVNEFFSGLWEGIKSVWTSVSTWFTDHVIQPLKDAFEGLQKKIGEIWDGIWTGIKTVINWIIGGIESFVNGVINGINFLIGGLNKVVGAAGELFGLDLAIPLIATVSIPRLAQGAVIPPNREFIAMLGDQKHGTNIETPLDTMVQAFKTALAEMGGVGGSEETKLTVEFKGQLAALARVLEPVITAETRRKGPRLVEDGV